VPKHVGAALVINILTKPSAQCWFSMYNPAMHGTSIKKYRVKLMSVGLVVYKLYLRSPARKAE
jgi:hypothetical protein